MFPRTGLFAISMVAVCSVDLTAGAEDAVAPPPPPHPATASAVIGTAAMVRNAIGLRRVMLAPFVGVLAGSGRDGRRKCSGDDEPTLVGEGHELGAVARVDLEQRSAHMRLGGGRGDYEL